MCVNTRACSSSARRADRTRPRSACAPRRARRRRAAARRTPRRRREVAGPAVEVAPTMPSSRCCERIQRAERSVASGSRMPRNSRSSRSSASIVTFVSSSPFHHPSACWSAEQVIASARAPSAAAPAPAAARQGRRRRDRRREPFVTGSSRAGGAAAGTSIAAAAASNSSVDDATGRFMPLVCALADAVDWLWCSPPAVLQARSMTREGVRTYTPLRSGAWGLYAERRGGYADGDSRAGSGIDRGCGSR